MLQTRSSSREASIAVDDVVDPALHTTPDGDGTSLNLELLGKDWKRSANINNRVLKSDIWKYGFCVEKISTGVRYWLCKRCHQKGLNPLLAATKHLYVAQTTSNPWKHIREEHKDITMFDESLDAFLEDPLGVQNTKTHTHTHQLFTTFSVKEFRAAYLTWVIQDNITLRQSVSPRLLGLFKIAHPNAAKALWSSHNTTRSHILYAYKREQKTISALISGAKSKISISFDGWMAGWRTRAWTSLAL